VTIVVVCLRCVVWFV